MEGLTAQNLDCSDAVLHRLRQPERQIGLPLLVLGDDGQGALHAVIDRRFSLNDIAHAYAYVETGHKKGSVIISTRDG